MLSKKQVSHQQWMAFGMLGLLCFSPLYQGGSPYPALTVLRLGVLLISTCIILNFFRQGIVQIPKSRVYPFIAFFFLFVIGTTLISSYKNISLEWGFILLMYLLFFVASLIVFRNRDLIFKGLVVLFALTVFEAVWGILQYYVLGLNRAKGTFFNPNFFGGFLSPMIILGLSCLFSFKREVKHLIVSYSHPRFLWFALGILVAGSSLMLWGLFLSGSRGAALSFFISFGILILARFKIKGFIALCLCLLIFFFTPNPVMERFLTDSSQNIISYSRVGIWKSSVQMAVDHPLGVGLGMFQYFWPRYNFPLDSAVAHYGWWSKTPHNEYLQVAVELGIGGLIIFILGLCIFGYEAWKAIRDKMLGNSKPVLLGLGCAILGTATHGLFDSNFHEPSIGLQFTFLCGLLLCLKNLALSQKTIDLRLPYLPQNVSRFYPVSALVISGLFALILIRPLVAYGYSSFGTQAYENGDVNRSIQLYNLASWWNPGKTQYHSNLAAALFRKFQENEDMDLANDSTFELNYARFLNPEDEKFTRRLGDVYSVLAFRTQIPEVRNDLYRLALRYYNQTMTLNPFQPRNYYEVGKIFLKMGDQKTAKDYFFQASKIEPNYLLARFALADLYTREGRLRDAIGEYIKILTTLKTYSKVTGLTPMEKEFLDVDEEKARNLLKKLQGII